jgi:hypothetical protein
MSEGEHQWDTRHIRRMSDGSPPTHVRPFPFSRSSVPGATSISSRIACSPRCRSRSAIVSAPAVMSTWRSGGQATKGRRRRRPTSIVVLRMTRHQYRVFSGEHFLISLKRFYPIARSCSGLSNEKTRWRYVTDIIMCPTLSEYAIKDGNYSGTA